MVLRLNPRMQDEPRGKFIPLFSMNFINEFPSALCPFFMDSLLLRGSSARGWARATTRVGDCDPREPRYSSSPVFPPTWTEVPGQHLEFYSFYLLAVLGFMQHF